MLDTVVKACHDMLLVHDGTVFIGKRQGDDDVTWRASQACPWEIVLCVETETSGVCDGGACDDGTCCRGGTCCMGVEMG